MEVISFSFSNIDSSPGSFRSRSQGRSQLVIEWDEQIGENLFAIAARGVLHIQDGTSNTVFLSERTGSTASCSADSTTGEPVLDSLTLLMRESANRPAEFVIVKIEQTAESRAGVYQVEIVARDQTFEGSMSVRSVGRPAVERGMR